MQEWPRGTPGRTVPWVGGQLLQQLPAATSPGVCPHICWDTGEDGAAEGGKRSGAAEVFQFRRTF